MGWLDGYRDDCNIDDGGPGETAVAPVFTVGGTPQIFDLFVFTDVSPGLQMDSELFCCGISWLPVAPVLIDFTVGATP